MSQFVIVRNVSDEALMVGDFFLPGRSSRSVLVHIANIAKQRHGSKLQIQQPEVVEKTPAPPDTPTPPVADEPPQTDDFTKIDGIGRGRATNLIEHGIFTYADLVFADPVALADELRASVDTVRDWQLQAEALQ